MGKSIRYNPDDEEYVGENQAYIGKKRRGKERERVKAIDAQEQEAIEADREDRLRRRR